MSKLFNYDKKNKTSKFLIGTDEAGRGPLAGPVVAAAVCFPTIDNSIIKQLSLVNDSKKLTHTQRETLFEIIKKNSIYSITTIDVEEIEKINLELSGLEEKFEQIMKDVKNTNNEISKIIETLKYFEIEFKNFKTKNIKCKVFFLCYYDFDE